MENACCVCRTPCSFRKGANLLFKNFVVILISINYVIEIPSKLDREPIGLDISYIFIISASKVSVKHRDIAVSYPNQDWTLKV